MSLLNLIGLFEYIQIPLVLLALIISFRLPTLASPFFSSIERLVRRAAERPIHAMVVIILAALGLRTLVLPISGVPDPMIADETSLYLQAETYLSGVLASYFRPSPDFETVFVNLTPHYESIYPLFRALPLALGGLVGCGFWAGVLGSMVSLCVATYWMLRAWIPSSYALAGALLVVARFGVFSYWVNSYWGGAFTALGGVLLLGGYKRLTRRPTVVAGACVGLGVFILMTTRPYEGSLFSVPFAIGLLVRFARASNADRKPLLVSGLLAAMIVAAGGVLTAVDNQVLTGDWRQAPYTLYRHTTASTPAFQFQKPNPQAKGRYYLTRAILEHEYTPFERAQTLPGWIEININRLLHVWNFYIGIALSLPFAIGLLKSRREVDLILGMAFLMLGMSIETWDFPHYFSPGFGFFIIETMVGLMWLRRWRPQSQPVGMALSRWLPSALAAGLALPVALSASMGRGMSFENDSLSSACCTISGQSIHRGIEEMLGQFPEGNIVRVHGGPGAPISEMIMYNGVDIPGQNTIWLNDDASLNVITASRYSGRRIWRLAWQPNGAACLRPDPPLNAATSASAAQPGHPSGGWMNDRRGVCTGGFYHGPWPRVIVARTPAQ